MRYTNSGVRAAKMAAATQTFAISLSLTHLQSAVKISMELRHLRYFIAVVDAGTFTYAAVTLNTHQGR